MGIVKTSQRSLQLDIKRYFMNSEGVDQVEVPLEKNSKIMQKILSLKICF